MITNTPTPGEISAAVEAKKILTPAVEALNKVGPDHIGHDLMLHINTTLAILEVRLTQAEEAINAIEARNNSPEFKNLVSRVSAQMFKLKNAINDEESTKNCIITSHQASVQKLKEAGYSQSQIDQIEPYPQTKIDDHEAKILALKAELEKIEAFIASSPIYDLNLLAWTEFDVSQVSEVETTEEENGVTA